MEFYQIIVTSSAENLDNTPGYGMVTCDKRLGEDIRRLARGWGYPESLQGQPAYTYRIDKEYVLMNRTVPLAVDHTGRRHYLSHTFAAPIPEVENWLENRRGEQLTPAEVMLGLPWLDTWEGRPRWMDESSGDAFNPDSISTRSFEPGVAGGERAGLLLTHEIGGDGTITPRKLIWEGGEQNTTALLRRFHEAWLVVDPWRGDTGRAKGLGLPAASLSRSWIYNFAISLRGHKPDDYTWICYAPGEETGSQRERFNCTNLDRVSERIRERFGKIGDELEERALNSEKWWSTAIRTKLQHNLTEVERSRSQIVNLQAQLEKKGDLENEISVLKSSLAEQDRKAGDEIASLKKANSHQERIILDYKEAEQSRKGKGRKKRYPYLEWRSPVLYLLLASAGLSIAIAFFAVKEQTAHQGQISALEQKAANYAETIKNLHEQIEGREAEQSRPDQKSGVTGKAVGAGTEGGERSQHQGTAKSTEKQNSDNRQPENNSTGKSIEKDTGTTPSTAGESKDIKTQEGPKNSEQEKNKQAPAAG